MLGLLGPLFAPVNPQNAQSAGFNAGDFGTGAMGAISRHPGRHVRRARRRHDARRSPPPRPRSTRTAIGALQVVEPSVLGVQVAYAGYFAHAGDRGRPASSKIMKTPMSEPLRRTQPAGRPPRRVRARRRGHGRPRRPPPSRPALDAMTKDELLDYADERGVEANDGDDEGRAPGERRVEGDG